MGSVIIRGDGTGGLNISATTCTVASATTVTLPYTNFVKAFPNQVDYLNPLTINWKYTGGGTTFYDAGASENPVYITLTNPATANMYRTVVHLACSNPGATTSNAAVANTWALFAGPANVNTWDAKTLYYYRDSCGWSGSAVDTGGLLGSANGTGSCAGHGQCGSFANLLIDAIGANGVNSKFIAITAANGDGFIVKDWNFASNPTYSNSPPYLYKLTLVVESDSSVGMVPAPSGRVYGDLTKQNTLYGQNTAPPSEEAFGSHYIVKYGTGYYDPSYGHTYVDSNDFENVSVDGYFRSKGDPNNPLDYEVKTATGLHNIKFSE